MATPREVLDVDGQDVTITNPQKVYFPAAGVTKLDLVRYYLAVAEGALRANGRRPMALKRYVNGIEGQAFYQKRAPENRPDWIETVELRYPSGRTADEIVLRDRAQLAWVVNLGCLDMHPHAVRADDLEHPDELRIDLDPIPGVPWEHVREVALACRDVLADHGIAGFPKTSGSRGMHIFCRIQRRWSFVEVRRAALALAREVEARVPDLATSRWWKEERHGVFIDYNQNAKDHTTTSAYSVRPTPDARVSAPLEWDEVAACDPADFTLLSVPARFAAIGDPAGSIDDSAGDLTSLVELAAAQKAAGMDDPPPPPPGEGSRSRSGGTEPVAPSPTGRRRPTMPLIEIARAAGKDEAMAGLERWKERHPNVWIQLQPADVLVDSMRGRSSTWTRIRLNLRHVPEDERPPQEPLEVDFDPWAGVDPATLRRGRPDPEQSGQD
ncbi:MAG TPA: non-homologous end-joining DNA ligase [Micromonosporaceae bacterium]|jgi:DNA ligase D-like protein (predicted polymerase)